MAQNQNKKQTCLLLSKEILSFCKQNKINLSEWANIEFTKQYLSIDTKKKQIEILQKELAEMNERADVLSKELTSREIRYIYQVTPRRREGKSMVSMCAFFNNEYGRNLSLAEFQSLVDFYEKAAISRIKAAIQRGHQR